MDISDQSFYPYYRWWYGVENSGLVVTAVTEYYTDSSPKEVLQARVGDTTYQYPFLTRDKWSWADTAYQFDFTRSETQKQYQWHLITSAVSRMSYSSSKKPVHTVSDVEEQVWNGDLYTVSGLTDETREVTLAESDFYSVLSTSEPFVEEFHTKLYEENISVATEDITSHIHEGEFPVRDKYAGTIDDILTHTQVASHSIGGTYPVILQTENGFELVLSKRSTEVMSWPGYWGVIPAGYFAPDGIDSRLGVLNQFYSEYCEELFSVDEGTVTGQHKQVREVEDAIANDDAEFQVTGFGVTGLSVSFEVSGVYVVYDTERAEQMKQEIDGNYESEEIAFVSLSDSTELQNYLHPTNITAPSAFAVLNAIRYLQTELSKTDQPKSFSQIEVL